MVKGTNMLGTKNNATRRIREIESELDSYRRRIDEMEGDQRDAHERADRLAAWVEQEKIKNIQAAEREAADWPDAFDKQIRLVDKELAFAGAELDRARAGEYPEKSCGPDGPVDWWQKQVLGLSRQMQEIQRVKTIYAEEVGVVQRGYEAAMKVALEDVVNRMNREKLDALGVSEYLLRNGQMDWLCW